MTKMTEEERLQYNIRHLFDEPEKEERIHTKEEIRLQKELKQTETDFAFFAITVVAAVLACAFGWI